MIAPEYFNNHVTVEGEIVVKRVPNDTGSVLVWNPNTNKISQRTKAEIIADLSLMATHTEQNVLGAKWFETSGGNTFYNHSLRVISHDGSNPGMGFYKSGTNLATLYYTGNTFAFTNSDVGGFSEVKSGGFIKSGSSNDYFLTGDGSHLSKYKKEDSWVTSQRNFISGTFISTSIDYSQSQGAAWLLEIKANVYGNGIPMDCKVQGYIYSDTIINATAYCTNPYFKAITAMNVGGKLCFWFPRMAYWQGFSVRIHDVTGGGDLPTINQVVSIDDIADPGGSKRVDILIQTLATKEELISGNAFWAKKNIGGAYWGLDSDKDIGTFNGSDAQRLLSGGLLASNAYADSQFIPPSGIHSKGSVQTDEGFVNRYYKVNQRNKIWNFGDSTAWGLSYFQGGYHPDGEGVAFHFGDATDYKFFVKDTGDIHSKGTVTVMSPDSVGSQNIGTIGTDYKLILGNGNNTSGAKPNYGTAFWIEGNGQGYIQQQRFDGNNVAYRLNLQPYGGELYYGDSEVATQNWINNNSVTLNAVQTITGLKQFNNTLAMGDGHPIFLKGSADTAHYIKHFSDDTDGFGVSTGFAVKGYNALDSNWFLVNASGAYINGNEVLHTGNHTPLPYYNNWSGSTSIAERRVIGEIAWKNYGNGHTIIDISSGVTPTGVNKPRENAENQWAPSYPTLVGYNGDSTFGVRVDSCRSADTLAGLPPGYFLQALENATAVGFTNGNPNDINYAPYIYSKLNNSYTFLATQNWTSSKFVSIDGQQDITGLKIIKGRGKNTGTDWGNTSTPTEYSFLVETGSGSDVNNQYTASIGFFSNNGAQAGIYARSNEQTGTSMAFATTNSFAAGPQIAMTIGNDGTVNYLRERPKFKNHVIWDEGNLTSAMIDNWNNKFKDLKNVADLNLVSESGIYRQETPNSKFNYTTTLNLNSSDGRQQLTIDRAGYGMKFRGSTSGSGGNTWGDWRTVWSDLNFSQSNIDSWNYMSQNGIIVNQKFTNNTNNRLIVVDEYHGGDSGIYDENEETYLVALHDEYYKYSSGYFDWEGINFNKKWKKIGIGSEANDKDKVYVSGSVKATKNFKSENEDPQSLFIPDGSIAQLKYEVINEDKEIRLNPREYYLDSYSFLEIDDRHRLIHIMGEYVKMAVNFKEIYPKQQIVIYNFDPKSSMEVLIQGIRIYTIKPNCFLRLYVTKSLRVIAETQQPCEMVW